MSAPIWDREDTERWLNDYGLPADFVFNGAKCYPRYALKKGYGFWLRTAGPYHPALRGLFSLCHEILREIPVGSRMPYPEELADRIRAHVEAQKKLPLHMDDIQPAVQDRLAAEQAGQTYEPPISPNGLEDIV